MLKFYIFITFIICAIACYGETQTHSSLQKKQWHISCQSVDNVNGCSKLSELLKKIAPEKTDSVIHHFIDSLGFSHARFDSTGGICTPGSRAVVKNEQIRQTDTTFNHFSETVKYPCLFDAAVIEQRARYLNRICAENGFPFATITIETAHQNADSLHDTLSIIYTISPDQRTRFASPRFRTSKKTSPALLSHYIDIKDSDLFDIRKIESSVKRLKNSAFIANVNVMEPLLLPDTLTSDSSALATIPFEIQDRSGLAFEGAVGFESDDDNRPSLRGSATFSLLNMFHTAEAMAFQYKGSDDLQLFDITLSKPWIFNLPFQIKINGGMEIETESYGYLYGDLRLLTTFGTYWQSGFGIAANETSSKADSLTTESRYFGLDFLLSRTSGESIKGTVYNNLTFVFGSGIAKKEKNYSRSNISFNLGMHFPVLRSQAIAARLTTAHIITNESSLVSAEMNRAGGHSSIRGYTDNEFSFRTLLCAQGEIIHYFSTSGSVYILLDGGIGFADDIDIDNKSWTKMIGYGAGIRIPSKIGLITIEWARNYLDRKSPGRIHLQFRNELSSLTEKFL